MTPLASWLAAVLVDGHPEPAALVDAAALTYATTQATRATARALDTAHRAARTIRAALTAHHRARTTHPLP